MKFFCMSTQFDLAYLYIGVCVSTCLYDFQYVPVFVCCRWGVPLDRFENTRGGSMKGPLAGALGHTIQWWNSRWLKQMKSDARRAEGEGQRVGAGW